MKLGPSARPDIGERIGAAIRSTADGFGWSQRELAIRLGSNQSAVRRLMSGGRSIDVRLATAALDCLGIRLSLDANPIGLRGRAEQRDLVHAHCCGFVIRQLVRRGWQVRAEVEIGDGRFRGWIDLLALRAEDGALLVIEVKTEISDLGSVLRTLGWYRRSARETAQLFGWQPRHIVPVLIVLATVETDARLAAAADLVRAGLPGDVAELAWWIDDATQPAPAGSLTLIDPASRRREWLSRTTGAGRRRPAPYADYRAAAWR